MPQIKDEKMYMEVYNSAKEVFRTSANISELKVERKAGTPLYRYVGYRNAMPQEAVNVKKIWSNLDKDIDNRWTGRGANGNGSQGLYMSGEFLEKNSPFPELEYYQQKELPVAAQKIVVAFYEKDKKEDYIEVDAKSLKSMFLFTQTKNLIGLNLSLKVDGEYNPLLVQIFSRAKALNKDMFNDKINLEKLYTSDADASFCRAVGNAAFEVFSSIDFIQVTSARDNESVNIILRGNSSSDFDYLKAEGRTSFFVKEVIFGAGYTVDDLKYNGTLEV